MIEGIDQTLDTTATAAAAVDRHRAPLVGVSYGCGQVTVSMRSAAAEGLYGRASVNWW